MRTRLILIAAADRVVRRDLGAEFEQRRAVVVQAPDRAALVRLLHTRRPDAIVAGPLADDSDPIAAVREIRRRTTGLPVVVVAAESSEDQVIAALRAGVDDYFRPPFSAPDVARAVERCLGAAGGNGGCRRPGAAGEVMIGESAAVREIRAYIPKVAATNTAVLVTGETGTGKELVAASIHRGSPRRDRSFVPINCAAIPEALLESELFGYERGAFTGAHAARDGMLAQAHGGTAFFDEIGDMLPYAQAKILRVIESGELQRLGARSAVPIDVRIVAATNQDLDRLVAEDRFRKDLYFRLNVARIHLPPLRERREDIPLLLDRYLDEFNRQFQRDIAGFTDEALDHLLRYDWPGNVRELRNVLEAVFVNLPAGRITLLDLPEVFRRRLTEVARLPQGERERLLATLLATNWNKSRAAQKLRWSRMTVYRKMAKYSLVAAGPGPDPAVPSLPTVAG